MTEPERCPFCGAESVLAYGYTPNYTCGTEKFQILGNRGKKCLEAELAKWKGLVKEAVPVLTYFGCDPNKWNPTETWDNHVKARALWDRPEIKALMEAKEGG